MKRISLLGLSLVFAAFFAVCSFAQGGSSPAGATKTGAQPTGVQTPVASKIGWIDTSAFGDEKAGVVKYVNALKTLEAEMKPKVTQMQQMDAKIKQIAADLDNAQKNTAIPVDPKTLQAKQDEGQALQRQLEFNKKDYDAAVEKRSGEVLGPVSAEISKSIQEYAKVKGYSVILDINALAQANAILALDTTSDVTKDFIAYYNQTHPAGTASTTTPK
jgi:Skp family chaperone for outer membrane proteins